MKNSYLIPRMDDCIDSLAEATVFSALDANCVYWKIPVKTEYIHKIAYSCVSGLYEFANMPFRLINAPATFQRVLDIIFARYKWQTWMVYLDGVAVYSKNFEEHLQH